MAKKNKGIIYLSGGGNVDKTLNIDQFFLNLLPKYSKLLFIPLAKDSDDNYEENFKWLNNKLNKIDNKKEIVLALNLEKFKDLSNFAAVYIGGGNIYKLIKLMRNSGFDKVLKEYIYDGGAYYGSSAGAVIMGKKISIYSEEKGKYKGSNGLNMLGKHSIVCHYNRDKDIDRINNYFKINDNSVIAIPTGTALYWHSYSCNVVGIGTIKLFNKNEPPLGFKPSSSFIIN